MGLRIGRSDKEGVTFIIPPMTHEAEIHIRVLWDNKGRKRCSLDIEAPRNVQILRDELLNGNNES